MARVNPRPTQAFGRQTENRIEARRRQMQRRVQWWLWRRAMLEVENLIPRISSRKLKIRKGMNEDALEAELRELLTRFAVRHINSTGSSAARSMGAELKLTDRALESIIRDKQVKVKRISQDVRDQVRNSIKGVLASAAKEVPKPSVGEIARRIRTQYHGPPGGFPKGRLVTMKEPEFGILETSIQGVRDMKGKPTGALYTFSPERAALIARTEAAQTENLALYMSMKEAGVEEIEWISSRNPNRGDRQHGLMNGKTVKLGDLFTTPLGNKLRFPGDPRAVIKETANCGCTFAPVRLVPRKLKTGPRA